MNRWIRNRPHETTSAEIESIDRFVQSWCADEQFAVAHRHPATTHRLNYHQPIAVLSVQPPSSRPRAEQDWVCPVFLSKYQSGPRIIRTIWTAGVYVGPAGYDATFHRFTAHLSQSCVPSCFGEAWRTQRSQSSQKLRDALNLMCFAFFGFSALITNPAAISSGVVIGPCFSDEAIDRFLGG